MCIIDYIIFMELKNRFSKFKDIIHVPIDYINNNETCTLVNFDLCHEIT